MAWGWHSPTLSTDAKTWRDLVLNYSAGTDLTLSALITDITLRSLALFTWFLSLSRTSQSSTSARQIEIRYWSVFITNTKKCTLFSVANTVNDLEKLHTETYKKPRVIHPDCFHCYLKQSAILTFEAVCVVGQLNTGLCLVTKRKRKYGTFPYYALQPLRLIVRSELDVPTFATRRLHASPRKGTQWQKVELWARNVREFCLNADVTFMDLLNAVKLRHGTDGFTSPPKEDVLRIFSP
jgi:hypothetical protein